MAAYLIAGESLSNDDFKTAESFLNQVPPILANAPSAWAKLLQVCR